jgi:hypothetical protein
MSKSVEVLISRNDFNEVQLFLEYVKERNIIKDWAWHPANLNKKGEYEIELTLYLNEEDNETEET